MESLLIVQLSLRLNPLSNVVVFFDPSKTVLRIEVTI